ncbi:hypothetical protein WJX81_007454 [Elliptochloris bilobata]|uniref:Small-subunit processome Utp12 domain-containing protein n=1 Tax=Elliptochloris bilobata TaxID=381761 RepID=A0AAW1RJ28_9CHLO
MLATGLHEGLHTAFSPGQDFLAIASNSGRLRTFDTSTGRLALNTAGGAAPGAAGRNSGSGLAGEVTALCWAAAPAKAGQLLLVVGTAAGDVRAFSAATGEVAWATQGCNEGGVTSVANAAGAGAGGMVYCVGADAAVCALDPSSGTLAARWGAGNHPLACVAASPGCQAVLVGSSSLALWDVACQKRTAKLTGHTTPVQALAFSPGGRWALSAASGERHVAIWAAAGQAGAKAGGKEKKRKAAAAAGLLALEEPAVSLATAADGADGDEDACFQVAAVSEAGRAYVWECRADAAGRVEAALRARISVCSRPSAESPDAVLAADFEASSSGATLLVARGSSAKPDFERVALPAAGEAAAEVQLEPRLGGVLLQDAAGTSGRGAGAVGGSGRGPPATARAGGAQAAAVGPEAADAALLKPTLAGASGGPGRRKRRAEELSANGVPGGGPAGERPGAGAPAEGLTLGERLAALQLQAGGPDAMAEDAAPPALAPGRAKADSLAVLLGQALRAGDQALLEKCLAVGGDAVISKSVRGLRPPDAGALLAAAVARLQAKASRGAQLAAWIRAVLLHHTAYLMAAPGVQPALAALYQVIEARVALQRPLASLAGRLDLLVAHMPMPGAAPAKDADIGAPMVVYNEADEDVPVEDPFAGGEAIDGDAEGSEGWQTDEGEETEDEDADEEDEEELSDG